MTSPRLTFRDRSFSSGSMVEPLPKLREAYGLEIADIVETTRCLVLEMQPRDQDVRRTLERVRDWPPAQPGRRYVRVPFDDLDDQSQCLLLAQSHRLYGQVSDLSDEQLRLCALQALSEHKPGKGGRPSGGTHVITMLQQLARLKPSHTADERFSLAREALACCGVGHSPKNVELLLQRARQEANARGAPLPRAKRKTSVHRAG